MDNIALERIEELMTAGRFHDKKIFSFIDLLWGDNTKVAYVDRFAPFLDVIARGTGGPNSAGEQNHNGKSHINRQIPGSIMHDPNGVISLMGNGMSINYELLANEIDSLANIGIMCNNLMISEDAGVILPIHRQLDQKNTGMDNGKKGTTGQGMGPCYGDWTLRYGIRVGDFYNVDKLRRRLNDAKEGNHPGLNVDDVIDQLMPFALRIKDYVRDTRAEMLRFIKEGKRIGLVPGQGNMLSIDHGTYPYVTSSNSSANGVANGVGISASDVDVRF